MLLSLNDDCLRIIMKLLTMEEQIVLAHLCQRLKVIAIDIWKPNNTTVKITSMHWEFFKDHEDYLLNYIEIVSDQVETLSLVGLRPSFVNGFRNIHFPKLHTLSVLMDYTGILGLNRNVEITTEIFPNLMSLTVFGELTGAHLCNFKNLQELNLYNCNNLQPEYLTKLFSVLKLKKLIIHFSNFSDRYSKAWEYIANCATLEEICIDVRYIYQIRRYLFGMKNLRKISFFTSYSRNLPFPPNAMLLNEIAWCWGNTMETSVLYGINCDCLYNMVSLRRLVFSGSSCIGDDDLTKISEWPLAKSLQEFYYLRSHCPREGLLEVIRQCTNLELCDLSGTNIDVNFVEEAAEIIQNQYGKRKQTLILGCHNTKVKIEDLETLHLPKEMQISLKKSQMKLNAIPCVVFERRL